MLEVGLEVHRVGSTSTTVNTTTASTTTSMKGIMSFLLATCLALASGDHGPEGSVHCHCGVFATRHGGLVQLDEFPHEHVADCSKVLECKTVCQNAWHKMMGSGNLDATTPDGITVGQQFCNNIVGDGLSNFGPHKVHGYSNICHGPLLYDDLESTEPLCCTDGLYKPCPSTTHIH
ncbi:uncharacterized protein LOC127000646 isoform X3 [Eriocheir sinensis]|uniref:uncharacterized protein LOC127000646 isoform X3 n=2 Tax=Eriocheir sinensis TaxID=95602 RepID=UPI0021C8ED83|nr:uncharacterized protein LOC127000646 isoform X3 [Eriocheir sinensis]